MPLDLRACQTIADAGNLRAPTAGCTLRTGASLICGIDAGAPGPKFTAAYEYPEKRWRIGFGCTNDGREHGAFWLYEDTREIVPVDGLAPTVWRLRPVATR